MIWGRAYFAVQALGGAAWWGLVAQFPWVREATLGSLDAGTVAVVDIPLFVIASGVAALGWRVAGYVATVWAFIVVVALGVFATVTSEAGWGVLIMAAAAGASMVSLSLLVFGRVPTEWITVGPFSFGQADAQAPTVVNVITTFGQIVVFWGFFLGLVPLILVFLERRWRVDIPLPAVLPTIGIVLFILASMLGVWSAISMSVQGRGTPLPSAMPNRLVISGPYRFVRNPMAIAGFVQGSPLV